MWVDSSRSNAVVAAWTSRKRYIMAEPLATARQDHGDVYLATKAAPHTTAGSPWKPPPACRKLARPPAKRPARGRGVRVAEGAALEML
jgi:hypothetical protein